jgi:DnaJ-class molecular chaperone
MGFLSGKKSYWECSGSGQSPRGYNDSSSCGTCGATGILKVHRIKILIEGIKHILRRVRKLF